MNIYSAHLVLIQRLKNDRHFESLHIIIININSLVYVNIMNLPFTQATQLKFIIIRDRIYLDLAFLKGLHLFHTQLNWAWNFKTL